MFPTLQLSPSFWSIICIIGAVFPCLYRIHSWAGHFLVRGFFDAYSRLAWISGPIPDVFWVVGGFTLAVFVLPWRYAYRYFILIIFSSFLILGGGFQRLRFSVLGVWEVGWIIF